MPTTSPVHRHLDKYQTEHPAAKLLGVTSADTYVTAGIKLLRWVRANAPEKEARFWQTTPPELAGAIRQELDEEELDAESDELSWLR